MTKYKVVMTQYYVFHDVEAESVEEAKDIVTHSYIWDDHFDSCYFHVENMEEYDD